MHRSPAWQPPVGVGWWPADGGPSAGGSGAPGTAHRSRGGRRALALEQLGCLRESGIVGFGPPPQHGRRGLLERRPGTLGDLAQPIRYAGAALGGDHSSSTHPATATKSRSPPPRRTLMSTAPSVSSCRISGTSWTINSSVPTRWVIIRKAVARIWASAAARSSFTGPPRHSAAERRSARLPQRQQGPDRPTPT